MGRLSTLAPRLKTLDTRTARPAPKMAESFYTSVAWTTLRDEVVRERGRRCEALGCGRTSGRVFVDHIVERRDGGAPLDKANLQVLCGSCHTRKTAAARAKRLKG
ncbi:HNH endonuclease signature motif containing protein [Methylobacterium segetis]|uniref:HNH endonuclease signature motif containing protein n=1 Tax=Methylobacterium segetis TaxID=2488750 RepID=UPI00104DE483|nr:HNH endonuclease signature motif containing protein [Methylobacterium segetis]